MKAPKLSQRTIKAVGKVITGDTVDGVGQVGPYQSGPKLIDFFNEFGSNDVYPSGGGFPSRWAYAEGKLAEANEQLLMIKIIEAAVSPQRYLDTGLEASAAVEYANRYLEHDGYELILLGKTYRLRRRGEPLVETEARLSPTDRGSHEFIQEQVAKCDRKLQESDYDGAITNARSLVEAVLFELEGRLDQNRPDYDGDLPRLYKRVQKLLNLDPSRADISDSLRQLLSGLTSVVAGLAPLRNKMGDAHVRTYKPGRHHAKLAVNAAKTITDFIIDSYDYQRASGRLPPGG